VKLERIVEEILFMGRESEAGTRTETWDELVKLGVQYIEAGSTNLLVIKCACNERQKCDYHKGSKGENK